MTISNEAIESAARAICAADLNDEPSIWHRRFAEAVLITAAPILRAVALREAADAADDPSPYEMDFYQIDQAQVGNWLRARADQSEEKSE